jgi:glycosyltransferase involved in cell wall biosynthesis
MITATDFLYEAYATNGFPPDRLKKINFGIKLDLVKGYQERKEKTDSVVRFGYVGQIAPHKGLDLLIKAYLRLRGGNKSLVVYGPFDQDRLYMNELLRLCSGIDEIEFRNTFPREELAFRLSELDILVIPSRWYENSPLVLLYALATKTPVVVTDVKGMSEFVKDGFNGYTFQKDSVDDLTVNLQKIMDDPSCIERLSKNATYTKDVSDHAQEVLKVYKEALRA